MIATKLIHLVTLISNILFVFLVYIHLFILGYVHLKRLAKSKSYKGDSNINMLVRMDDSPQNTVVLSKDSANIYDLCPELRGSIFCRVGNRGALF